MTFQDALHVLEIIDKECRMRLRCRTEVFLYTHVNLPIADPKPYSTPGLEVLRLVNFFHTEETAVKCPRRVLLVIRDCDLDVINVF